MNLTKIIPLLLLSATLNSFADSPRSTLDQPLPERWQYTPQAVQTLPTDDAWWTSFNDPVLDSLINKAVANNYNVASALKRIEMAGKVVSEARSGYFPTVSLNGGWTQAQNSGATGKTVMPSSTDSYFSVGAAMNWEIDLFGRIKAQVKSKKAAYNASRAEYDGVMVSLCANVASTYIQLRTYQKQLEVAEKHIAQQKEVVRITEARFEAELADMLDVTQAKTVLYNTQTSVPGLRTSIRTLINTLSVLVGEYPGSLADALSTPTEIPAYTRSVEAGVPSDILRRRPDIVEAEMNLAQYAANVGIAKKDFLPTLSFSGNIGTSAHSADNLFGQHSLSYSIAPQLSWTLFDGMARNYRTAEAKLQMEAAIDSYNLTVLNAVEEVDNALLQYDSVLQSIELQREVVVQSEKSRDLAVDLYKAGLTAFSNVVDGQMNFLSSQNTLVELEGKAVRALITIYQALGGGFGTAK